ncbi:diaminobutyrate--2-oxoglutarate transaminase family protein [Haliangium ochraceum]|uniref:2,4-diaminobutyrate 4-transaminase n=1 Tax=Haliangium ochraceum (strain DSM 14365 / JCM 11303 / SMP-2) TaxID=502025 RepID=D0LMF1_HALO1|nr:diaminobutyrate--2-oxoglutarate transaminase family protein [Haliangium ochraceum]ACY16857.1 2,4-diaminobutyrate 4-transaminase [Haliangium ochraceum DSM 14365]
MDERAGGLAIPADGRPTLRGQVPGPRSRELLARQAEHESNARTYPRKLQIGVRRALGSYLEDVDGNVFIDFLSGAGAVPLGHGHPELLAAVHRQAAECTHMLDFPTPIKDAFTRELLSMLPAPMQERMKLQCCGAAGADAVDAAIKLCKTATGRAEVVSFQGGFHGSTQSTLALTGLRAPKEPLENLMPGVHFFPYAHCFRCPLALKPDTCSINCVQYLERALRDENGGVRSPAAVILELVQGEGGVIPAQPQFVRELRRITRELRIPLIVDEIQSGCGRTGTWFAFEHFDIEPDVIVLSKALGGLGLPIALILYDRSLDVWGPGAHTGTFRGNQLAFAASLEMMRVVRRERILDHVTEEGAYLRARLEAAQQTVPIMGDVRGLGLMLGVEIVDPRTGREAPRMAAAVQEALFRRGLLMELGGRGDCVLRFLPPLNVARTTLDAALDILLDTLAHCAAESPLAPEVRA